MTFRVGVTRDLITASGEPCFDPAAFDELAANPDIEWEWMEDCAEITPDHCARYDAIHVNLPRVTAASVAREDRRVKIRRSDGRIEVITAEGADAAKPATEPKTTAEPSAEASESGIEKISETEYVVPRELLDEQLADLEGLSRMGRALLHRGPDGEFDGYRLSAIRRGSLPDQLGIRNGDVIHTVNGMPLSSVQGAMNAFQTLQNEAGFSFEVTRRGQTMEMGYQVK